MSENLNINIQEAPVRQSPFKNVFQNHQIKTIHQTLDNYSKNPYQSEKTEEKILRKLSNNKQLLESALDSSENFDWIISDMNFLLDENSSYASEGNKKLVSFAGQFIRKNSEKLGAIFYNTKDPNKKGQILQAFSGLLRENFPPEYQTIGIDFLVKNWVWIPHEKNSIERFTSILNNAYSNPLLPKSDINSLNTKVLEYVNDPDPHIRRLGGRVIDSLTFFHKYSERTVNMAHHLQEQSIILWGFDPLKLKKDWKGNNSLELYYDYQDENFKKMAALEALERGSCKYLNEIWGIEQFARDPVRVLNKQVQDKDGSSNSYGIFLASGYDPNGALVARSDAKIEYFFNELQEKGYSLRMAECNNQDDFLKRFGDFDKLYGQQTKISFVILNAHNIRGEIHLGYPTDNYDSTHTLDREFFISEEFKNTQRYLTKDAIVIILGCSTGNEGGQAQIVSKSLQRRVYGLTKDTNYSALHAYFNNGKLDTIQAEIINAKLQGYYNGQKI